MTVSIHSKFTIGQRLVLAVVPRVVWALLWLISGSWRFEEIAEEGVTPLIGGSGAGARKESRHPELIEGSASGGYFKA